MTSTSTMTPLTSNEQVSQLKKGAKLVRVLNLNGNVSVSAFTVKSNRANNLKMTNDKNGIESIGINLEYARAKWFIAD